MKNIGIHRTLGVVLCGAACFFVAMLAYGQRDGQRDRQDNNRQDSNRQDKQGKTDRPQGKQGNGPQQTAPRTEQPTARQPEPQQGRQRQTQSRPAQARQPQRTQQQARAWQQQQGWLQRGGGWQGKESWQGNRARQWASDHRTWQQRGGYGGYYIPQDRFVSSFGAQHYFRIRSRPVMYLGYPRFEYSGFSFLMLDPWPEFWSENWYDSDDVYVDYDDGYYLHNRRDPAVRIAITIAF